MGDSYTQPNLIRGTNNTNNSDTSGISPSRLLINTNSLRNDLTTRNLYTPLNEYPLAETGTQNLVNAINGIASLVAPFKSFNLENTVFGRVVGTQTPLTAIGTAMLGKQLAYNAGSSIAQEFFPTIKVANLFDGSKNTKLFTPNIDFKITKKKGTTGFQTFLDAAVYYYPANDYPFTKTPTNANFIENSGTGQLTFLFRAMNQNIYKEGFGDDQTTTPNSTVIALQTYSNKANFPITTRSTLIGTSVNQNNGKYSRYFYYFNQNPYSTINVKYSSLDAANGDIIFGLNVQNASQPSQTQEYAPNSEFVRLNLGKTITNTNIYGLDNYVNETTEFNENLENQLVWGRDSVSDKANEKLSQLRGNNNEVNVNITTDNNIYKKFNAYSGLLQYTRSLLNASEGAVVDITRKAFKKNQNGSVAGFNGSALWLTPEIGALGSTYSNYLIGNMDTGEIIADSTGYRQHSILDQYDRFAKTIRYVGNIAYNKDAGNNNSVIYNTVLPRIHPIINKGDLKDGYINNKNLMFSIENLAVRVIGNAGNLDYGIIDDEYGTIIPASEVGQFNGRLMWFPPYDVNINESTAAKYESTVMVGRSEPMYNYMNSERSATLSFTLLVDYPEQLKNSMYTDNGGNDKHRKIAEFFAFGGDPYAPLPYIDNPDKKIADNETQKNEITKPVIPQFEQLPSVSMKAYFPNDFPTGSEIRFGFDTLYKIGFQVKDKLKEATSGITTALADGKGNSDVYVDMASEGDTNVSTSGVTYLKIDVSKIKTQYENDDANNKLNKELKKIFDNKGNWGHYVIEIIGAASSYYGDIEPKGQVYNYNIGERRAEAAKELVQKRLKGLFNSTPDKMLSGGKIITKSIGSELANTYRKEYSKYNGKSFSSLSLAEQNELNGIFYSGTSERYAEIKIYWDGKPVTEAVTTNATDTKTAEQLDKDNAAISKLKNSARLGDGTFNERDAGDAIMGSFKSISGNKLYPTFHSQTPEDFHRRLTFLQQCMRQGAAMRYDTKDANGNLTAKNSVFGRQPICILRYGDFMFTKVIIENLTIDYTDVPWDTNPEGMGMQPMMAKITLQMKIIGGQSLKGPIDALQNAVSFNHYANSDFKNNDGSIYSRATIDADNQQSYINGVLTKEKNALLDAYKNNTTEINKANRKNLTL